MWDLIVSVPDHCLSFYFFLSAALQFFFSLILIYSITYKYIHTNLYQDWID